MAHTPAGDALFGTLFRRQIKNTPRSISRHRKSFSVAARFCVQWRIGITLKVIAHRSLEKVGRRSYGALMGKSHDSGVNSLEAAAIEAFDRKP
jgi:hypothetical protein